MVNNFGRITDKSGGTISSFSLASFFHVDAGFSEADPQVIYDGISGRWFATYLQHSTFPASNGSSSIILAVSTTSDPTGTFCRYRIGNPTSETFLQDFPMLGVSDDKVAVSYNGFSFADGLIGAGSYALNKADLMACRAAGFFRVAPDPLRFTPHPAQSLSSTGNLYVAMHSLSPSGTLTLLTITGVPGVTPVTLTPTDLGIRTWLAPPDAPQAASSQLLNIDDGRIQSVAWQANSLWLAGNEVCTPVGDTTARSCLRVIELRTDTSTLRQDMTFGAVGQYYHYPALRPDSSGNLHVVFTGSSAFTFLGVRVTGRLAADPLNTLQPSNEIRAGGGAQTDSSGRIGDYSGAAVDPSDTSTVWVMGEYIRTTASRDWGTYIAKLKSVPPPLTLTSLTADKSAPQLPGTTITFTATAAGGTAPYTYKWWRFDGTTWTVLQDWTPSNTFAWTPLTPNPAYVIGVWARSAGNTADLYDSLAATATVPFAITGGTAPTISNLQFSPPSAIQGSGTIPVNGSITFSDPEGDLALVRITVVSTGQFTDVAVNSPATSGIVFVTALVDTSIPGNFMFTVQAFDRSGNASNILTGVFTVIGGSSYGAPPSPG